MNINFNIELCYIYLIKLTVTFFYIIFLYYFIILLLILFLLVEYNLYNTILLFFYNYVII